LPCKRPCDFPQTSLAMPSDGAMAEDSETIISLSRKRKASEISRDAGVEQTVETAEQSGVRIENKVSETTTKYSREPQTEVTADAVPDGILDSINDHANSGDAGIETSGSADAQEIDHVISMQDTLESLEPYGEPGEASSQLKKPVSSQPSIAGKTQPASEENEPARKRPKPNRGFAPSFKSFFSGVLVGTGIAIGGAAAFLATIPTEVQMEALKEF